MVAVSTWLRYLASKVDYSVTLSRHAYKNRQISENQMVYIIWKHFFEGRLTFLHWSKGEAMSPMIGTQGGTVLVRKLPVVDPTRVYVGDVVVMIDPADRKNYLVRRLAAIEGDEMASTDEKDTPFVLEKDECWVLADNKDLKPKEAYDSRTFGPVTMMNILGRVIYCLRSAVDHGPVDNSQFSTSHDDSILEVELDVDEMAKNHKP